MAGSRWWSEAWRTGTTVGCQEVSIIRGASRQGRWKSVYCLSSPVRVIMNFRCPGRDASLNPWRIALIQWSSPPASGHHASGMEH